MSPDPPSSATSAMATVLGSIFSGSRQANTFRPLRNHRVGTRQYELHKLARATLGTGNLQESVMLPIGEDINEWLAMQTIEFYNEVNMVFGVVSEFCTHASCPLMCAGSKYEYFWADGLKVTKPMKVTARQYVELLMNWVQDQLDDERLFPTQPGAPFPPDFFARVQTIFRRLFRVYAHVYHSHFESVVAVGAEPHLNTCFKHFMYLVREFDLIPAPAELAPLQKLIDELFSRDAIKFAEHPSVSPNELPSSVAMEAVAATVGAAVCARPTPKYSLPNLGDALQATQLELALRASAI